MVAVNQHPRIIEFPVSEQGLLAALMELAPVVRGHDDTQLFYAEHHGSPHAQPWNAKELALRRFWDAGCLVLGMDNNPGNW